jgi:phage anti-repressor protein
MAAPRQKIQSPEYYVEKALQTSKKLDLFEFIEASEFPIDREIAKSFFTQMKMEIPIYLGKYEIEFFGYKGALFKQKEKVMKLLKKEYAEENGNTWLVYDGKKYVEFLDSLSGDANENIYPAVKKGRGYSETKHVLIYPEIYQELLMMASTDKSRQIRRYLVQLNCLVKCMSDYKKTYESQLVVNRKDDKIGQLMIEMKEQSAKIDNLLKHAEKSEVVAAEASADLRVVRRTVVQMSGGHVKADNIPVLKRHCFMILKAPRRRNNKYKIILAQNGYAGTVSNKIIARYSNVKVIVRMKCPNPNEFWASIKSACLGVMGRGKKIVQVANKSWIKFEGFTDSNIKSCVKKVDAIWRKNLPYPEPESFSDSKKIFMSKI